MSPLGRPTHGRCARAPPRFTSHPVPREDGHLPNRQMRRAVVILALAALALGLVAPSAGAIGADRPPPIVIGFPPDVTFYGRGWGHGVGMSQHGARGRALAGQAAPEILAHYFAGTTIGAI